MSTVTGDRPAAAVAAGHSVELAIGGMTCASCAARIEKKLSRLDGVTATVNFATEKARVSFPASVTPQDLVRVVEQAGYTAALSTGVPGGRSPRARGVPGGHPPRPTQRRPRCCGGCSSRRR